jgi:catechol 2,3-dioxygenase-like lactoylglutathione lyase family enzyme
MPIQFNHLIVHARDSRTAACFLSDLLGLPEPKRSGPFLAVETANGVTLDYIDGEGSIPSEHYAFLATETEFDEILAKIRHQELAYWADPGQHRPGRIYQHEGGRGVYFKDPTGHLLEVLTRPQECRP